MTLPVLTQSGDDVQRETCCLQEQEKLSDELLTLEVEVRRTEQWRGNPNSYWEVD